MSKLIPMPFLVLTLFLFSSYQIETDKLEINKILYDIISCDSTIINKDCKIVDGFNSELQRPASYYLDSSFFAQLDPFFQISDTTFYHDQIIENKDNNITHASLLNRYNFINKKQIDKFIDKTEKNYERGKVSDYWSDFEKHIGFVQEFSLPLVSKDKRFLLLRYYCIPEIKHNYGFERIYERRDDCWILIKTLKEWDKQ